VTSCHRRSVAVDTEKQTAVTPPSGGVRAAGEKFTLEFANDPALEIERNSGHLTVRDSSGSWGKIKLEADRVKVNRGAAEVAKAKAKDDGFKVYEGDREVFHLKRRGSGYSVRRADGTELGRTETTSATFSGVTLTVRATEAKHQLMKGDAIIASVAGSSNDSALFMLAIPDAPLAERLAMWAIVNEGIVR
jgi:hypothetical protein